MYRNKETARCYHGNHLLLCFLEEQKTDIKTETSRPDTCSFSKGYAKDCLSIAESLLIASMSV